MNAILHAVIRLGGVDHDFVARAHHRLRGRRSARVERLRARGGRARLVGIPARAHRRGGRAVGAGAAHHAAARARHRAPHQGRRQRARRASTSCSRPARSASPAAATPPSPARATGRAAREHGQRCNQLPGARDIENPEHRAARRRSAGACRSERCPARARPRREIVEMIHRGEIRGLLSLCFNPLVSLPDATLHARGARAARLLRRDRLLPLRDRAPRRPRPARLAARGGRGHGHQRRGPRDPHPQGGRAARRGAAGLAHHLRPRASGSAPASASTFAAPAEIFDELRARLARRHRRLLRHHLGEDRAADGRLLAVPDDGPSRARRGSSRAAASIIPTAARASTPSTYRPPAEDVDDEYPIILTTGRVVSQFLSGTQTRRIGPLVDAAARAAASRCTRAWRARLGIADGERVRVVEPARRARARGARRRDDPARHRLHPVPLARRALGEPADRSAPTIRSPASRSSRWRRCASSGSRAGGDAHDRRALHRRQPLHRLPRLRGGVQRMSGPRRAVDDPPRLPRARRRRCRRAPTVCMHCAEPACARVCPADAIKVDAEGVVLTAMAERCIGCGNCALACPFGVPKLARRARAHDEVRPLLRPHRGRAEADVRHGVPVGRALLRHARGGRGPAPRAPAEPLRRSATSWCARATT